ncbi:MAG: nucleotidyltransferase domain-containing protein [Bacteroidetes bacterium]|nr:nucleotidyltransferase domain-containing protein [Bacteroidota bacterium]MBU1677768.1 nucleotidyltransferase domain-containing protein [Bacteroidota bacterium]MBU2505515.1 nucleotidyltransferase domain-containing protein [Bacteroidota bacterium]
MRLKEYEIEAIKSAAKKYDENAQVYLFGSRTDNAKRGGDIDILLLSDKIKNKEVRKIRLEIFDLIGEQKIDIVTAPTVNSAFIEYAYKSGIRL